MYMIRAGKVDIWKKDRESGVDFLVASLGSGAAIGEMSLLTGHPKAATVKVVEPTSVYVITRADFQNLIQTWPEIALDVARVVAKQLEDSTKQVGIEYVNLFKYRFDPEVVGLIPAAVMGLHKVVAIALASNRVTIAMVTLDPRVFAAVRPYLKGFMIEPALCTEKDFEKFIEKIYPELMSAKVSAAHRHSNM